MEVRSGDSFWMKVSRAGEFWANAVAETTARMQMELRVRSMGKGTPGQKG
jgi:hypothetical protein